MCPYIIVLWSYKKLLGSGQPLLQTRAITVFNWCPNWCPTGVHWCSTGAPLVLYWCPTGARGTSWIKPLELCFFHIWIQRKIFFDKTMIKRRPFITNWLQEHDQISPKYNISVLICFGQKRSILARKSALRRGVEWSDHFFPSISR